MCGARFYRSLPYLYGIISILELVCVVILLAGLIGDWSIFLGSASATTNVAATTTIKPTTSTRFSKRRLGIKAISVAIGLFSMAVPVFTGMILCLSSCCGCIWFFKERYRRPFLRFLALNCNFPCYKPRPQLRFIVRISLHVLFMILRAIAVILLSLELKETSSDRRRTAARALLIVTAVSLIFPLLTILLDIYHYRVWWYYEPLVDNLPFDTYRMPLSSKHKRFVPDALLERHRTEQIGDRSCKYGSHCENRQLEHIVIFHSTTHQPQPRWSFVYDKYIGFHQTTPQAALSISRSEFRPSPRGMLGSGAYFARSAQATLEKIGQPDQKGAWFVAEIAMGRVYQVQNIQIRYPRRKEFRRDLEEFVRNSRWHKDYDTCYYSHEDNKRDEFCIKDPKKQILRWIIVVEGEHDRKLTSYGMHTELMSSLWGCI